MAHKKAQFAFFAIFISLFIILASVLIIDSVVAENQETKAETITILSGQATANDSLFLLSNNIVLPEVETKFEYNSVGLKWKKNNQDSENIIFYIKSENTDWIKVAAMESALPDSSDYIYSDPMFIQGSRLQVKIENYNASTLPTDEIQLIYFDSRQPNMLPMTSISSLYRDITGNKKLKVITREQWGANEEYRFWQPAYADPKAFVVHHTAGGNGGKDPAATVRAIYYWHAVVLGWGDIGYNYLVDQQGNIYEGRYGGDKAIGAHTYNSTDNINYNEGTIGISVLGCFEDEKNGCYKVSKYNNKIQKAVTNLIAKKSVELNINLKGKRSIFDKSVSPVIGHRDLDYTLCPGSRLQDKLSKIKKISKNKYAKIKGEQQYKGKLVSHNFSPAYYIDTSADIIATYKNTGDLEWPAEDVYLKVYNHKTKTKQTISLTQNVLPGEEISFNLSFLAEKIGKQDITLKLYRRNEYITGSKSIIKLRVDNPNKSKLKKHNIPVAVNKKWDTSFTIEYRNTGVTSWSKRDTALYINDKKVAVLPKDEVLSGNLAVFKINQSDIPKLKKGVNELVIYLKKDDKKIANSRFIWLLRLDK